jgi:Ser/Thr protein kinase RdoA (MazF antagonist)
VSSYHDRLNFDGNFDTLISRVANDFSLDIVSGHSIVEVGFEDFNVKISTKSGDYLAKIFSKNRTADEIDRNVTNIEKAITGGVNHPELMLCNGSALYSDTDSGLKMVVMRFIAGKTFYDLSTTPSDEDLTLIAAEAVKINSIDYDPPYLFDSWAIPNMQRMFDKVKDHLTDEGRKLVEGAFAHYERMPLDELPKCYVHGDLIKTNLIKGDDGKIYVIDFSVANTYPRIQELAVMAANLLFDEKSGNTKPLTERVDTVIAAYLSAGGTLTDLEKAHVFNYALPAAAMEYMGSVNERVIGDTSDEIAYWEKLGLNGLREALSIQ